MFNINNFVKPLNLKNWFSKIGKTEIAITNNLKYANSLENSLLIWINNLENRKNELEKLRSKLLKDETWNSQFEAVKQAAYDELKKSGQFTNFIRDIKLISNKLNRSSTFYLNLKTIVNPEIFVSQLPIIGYFGETLINNNAFKYHTNEIEYYKKGHFVSEHKGIKFLIY